MPGLKLSTQFRLLNSGLVIATVAVVAGASFFAQKRLLLEDIEKRQRGQAASLAEVCRQSLMLRDDLLIASYVKLVTRAEGVAYAYCADETGRIRVHSSPKFLYKPLDEWRAAAKGEPAVEVSAPAGSGASVAGIGFLKAYTDETLRKAVAHVGRFVAIAALAALVIGYLIAAGIAVLMTRPIQKLAQGAREIGRGNFQQRVTLGASSEEIAELASVFNQTAAQLAQLDEMKDEFISTVSHDLRAPVAAIISYADVLQMEMRGPLNETQREYMAVISNSGKRMTHFINDILDLAKIKAGRMEYAMNPVDIGDLAGRTVTLFALMAKMRSATLEYSGPPGLILKADEEKLERVLTNLVSNAMKFLPPEGGRVVISTRQDGETATVSVEDNGRGIAAEDLPKLFEKFTQLDMEAQRNLKIVGTGLGLTLVKSIVEAHGGRVWAESEPGRGARFSFTIPMS